MATMRWLGDVYSAVAPQVVGFDPLSVRFLFATIVAFALSLTAVLPAPAANLDVRPHGPEAVTVQSGSLELRALIWRPSGSGPFPAIVFSHGSASSTNPPQPAEAAILGDVFARHGYVFLFLFRQGLGLSAGQGTASGDLMRRAFDAGGQEGRNRLQIELLNGEELNEVSAALGLLRRRPEVDVKRIAVVGHSFGGSLSLVLTANDPDIRAGVIFGGAAGSWANSPELRKRLLVSVGQTRAPLLFIYAANDYSIAPARVLSAEMLRLGKVHESKIYPAFGRTASEGHNLVYEGVRTWESDVFGFLDKYMRHETQARDPAGDRRLPR